VLTHGDLQVTHVFGDVDEITGVVDCATVTAAIEPVTVGASAAGEDRCGAADVREGGFGLDPVKVVAGADEHLAGDLGSNTGKGNQGCGDRSPLWLPKSLASTRTTLPRCWQPTSRAVSPDLGGSPAVRIIPSEDKEVFQCRN
jgi:hypothetical protein